MKESFRKALKYVLIVVFFLVLAYGFVPQVLAGKIVNQSDISQWTGMTHETVEYNKANPDDKTAWNGAMFSGMPTVAMYDDFEGDATKPLYKLLLLGKRPATYLFVALLGAFLLMLALGLGILPAVGGAIAVAFCSYNMQIIQVGHNTKMQAIAFLPWVLAALVFTYRSALKKEKWVPQTLLGSVLFAFALSFQVKANHPQITWYLAGIILIYALVVFIDLCVRNKKAIGKFFAASALLLVIGLVGIATNANKLIPTWEYTKYTMRGGSELSGDDNNKKGLDLDYATSWSYGIEETPNLLIPNFNGGSSAGKLSSKSETAALLKKAGYRGRDLNSTLAAMPLYWGPQPFTAGPMYVGCISLFLFMLGLFLYKGKEKWWLLAASVLAIMLAWGSHMMWFTRFMMDCAPMYNKFRTVSMALVVLQVTVPMLAFLVLDHILKGEYEFKAMRKPVVIAYALTAGFCLLCALFPGIAGSFSGSSDASLPEALRETLAEDRASLLRSDAFRSLVLITLVALVLHVFAMPKKTAKFSSTAACAIICALVLFDLFFVGKRYLGADDFVTKKDFAARYTPREVDKIILEDKSPSYRVVDISTSTFNDAFPSYFHKSVGGYSPAKLQRYQDLIEKYLSREINSIIGVVNECKTVGEAQEKMPYCPVLSALNTRYVILGDDYAPLVNDWAYGTAWFVDNVVAAETPDEEIEFVGLVDLFEEAVVGKDFEWVWNEFASRKEDFADPVGDNDFIEMVSYSPKEVRYAYDVEKGKIAVFSEIYFPKGWKAYISPDEKSILEGTGGESGLELFRADWILRGAMIPAGSGEIIMRFEPDSYRAGANVSRASSAFLVVLLVLSAWAMFYKKKEE